MSFCLVLCDGGGLELGFLRKCRYVLFIIPVSEFMRASVGIVVFTHSKLMYVHYTSHRSTHQTNEHSSMSTYTHAHILMRIEFNERMCAYTIACLK